MNKTRSLFETLTFIIIIFFNIFSYGNVIGVDTQNFSPTTSGLDFVTVQSSETLMPGVFNLGIFFNYAANSLPNLVEANNQKLLNIKDTLLSADFNVGLGLTTKWDIGISIPQILVQTVDNTVFRAQYEETGVTEIRVNTKYRLWGNTSNGLAAIFSINFPLIENNPFTGKDPSPIFNFELAYDKYFNKTAFAVNLGYRIRNSGEALQNFGGILPLGNQFTYSGAFSYLFSESRVKLIGEIFGSVPIDESEFPNDRDSSSLEALVGAKWDINYKLAFHAGIGTEIFQGAATPDWRLYSGLNYAFGPVLFKKKPKMLKNKLFRIKRIKLPKDSPIYKKDIYTAELPINVETEDFDFTKAPTQEIQSFIAQDILFQFNSDKLNKKHLSSLNELNNYLKKYGFKKLVIIGHTDSVGKKSYNLSLSKKRAKTVKKMISTLGQHNPRLIVTNGKGETQPIADNGNYQGRQLNRRVEFFIFHK